MLTGDGGWGTGDAWPRRQPVFGHPSTIAGTDYYGIGLNNTLEWVNRGTNAAPTAGQTNPYTLFTYDTNGRLTYRDRRYDGGLRRTHDFWWDGDDRLRSVTEGEDSVLSANYDGSGLRVWKWDPWTEAHDYSWNPGGVLHDSSGDGTTYTPGLSQRTGTTDRFAHGDWLGSTRYLSDATGNGIPNALRYDAFGGVVANAGGPHPPGRPHAAPPAARPRSSAPRRAAPVPRLPSSIPRQAAQEAFGVLTVGV